MERISLICMHYGQQRECEEDRKTKRSWFGCVNAYVMYILCILIGCQIKSHALGLNLPNPCHTMHKACIMEQSSPACLALYLVVQHAKHAHGCESKHSMPACTALLLDAQHAQHA